MSDDAKAVSAPAPFSTHTAEEVGKLSDEQVRMMWRGAHQWISGGRDAVKGGKEQLRAIEAEMRRRGIFPTERTADA